MSGLTPDRVRELLALHEHPNAECTGAGASWCPVCGDCTCPWTPEGRGDEADDCALHGVASRHATVDPEPLRDAAPELAASLLAAWAEVERLLSHDALIALMPRANDDGTERAPGDRDRAQLVAAAAFYRTRSLRFAGERDDAVARASAAESSLATLARAVVAEQEARRACAVAPKGTRKHPMTRVRRLLAHRDQGAALRSARVALTSLVERVLSAL